jgi:hypothetical protein
MKPFLPLFGDGMGNRAVTVTDYFSWFSLASPQPFRSYERHGLDVMLPLGIIDF